MEKLFTTTGINGTFEGKVLILTNYTTKTIECHNDSTHDSFPKEVSLHEVGSFIKSKDGVFLAFKISKEIETLEELKAEAIALEEELQSHLNSLANNTAVKSFSEQMKELGYNN